MIAIASGSTKAAGILGLLKTGVVNTLATSLANAHTVLAFDDATGKRRPSAPRQKSVDWRRDLRRRSVAGGNRVIAGERTNGKAPQNGAGAAIGDRDSCNPQCWVCSAGTEENPPNRPAPT